MVNYACAFSQSETEEYFKRIIMLTILYAKSSKTYVRVTEKMR